MLPYLIAGAIGFVVGKLLEEDEAPKYADGGSVLLAPNGKPSNLTPEQYKLVRTPAFKQWFGDWENDPETASKVVDENGEPSVVYHGSKSNFNVFDVEKSRFDYLYFAVKKEYAEKFGKTKSYFINARKIKDATSIGLKKITIDKAYKLLGFKSEPTYTYTKDEFWQHLRFSDKINRTLRWNKYDGVKYIESNLDDGSYIETEAFVILNPSIIKLADGTNTTFDGNNPDIRFAGGGSVNELKFSNEIESDAMGYDIGDYLYHITPVSNFDTIINKGFIPKNGVAINGKPFENRLYFATSLISAYDLSVNFGSYRDDAEYVIFKIKSDCIDDYEEDNLFAHGIYIDYKISNKCILGYVNANDLFNKFDDEDLENLYY
jgi:hypothetical protein